MRSGQLKTSRTLMLVSVLSAAILLTPLTAWSDNETTWPLYVNVEQRGKPVAGLGPSNFRVFLDGRSREFSLESAEIPASVVLLVEYSQRSWLYMDDIRSAIEGFLEHAPEGNWYALVTFDRNTNIVVDFTKQKSRIASAFFDLPEPQWDDISTYEALSNILDTMSRLSGRRVIVFVGSGFDIFSRRSFGDVEQRLESTDVIVYSLGAGSALRTRYDPYAGMPLELDLLQARGFLTMLADKSGGEAWFPNTEAAYRNAIEAAMEDLATQYKLVVHAAVPNDGRLHKIKVEAFSIENDRRKDFKVRVREGFRAAGK
jgi:VWFA-related protein